MTLHLRVVRRARAHVTCRNALHRVADNAQPVAASTCPSCGLAQTSTAGRGRQGRVTL